jgi:hypothetical protein
MNTYIFYQPNAPGSDQEIERFAQRLAQVQVKTELINADSRRGIDLTQLYDCVDRPAVVVVNDEGSVLQSWQGSPLPPIEEISYHFQQ